jgi:Amt family ammonium transporter
LLGTTLIWFGFFGFNGGSAFSLSDSSVLSLINTNISGVVAGLGWLYMEYLDGASPSILGLTNGCVCGLVAITPASGYVAPWASFLVGIGAAFLSFIFIKKIKFLIFAGNYDDTLGNYF